MTLLQYQKKNNGKVIDGVGSDHVNHSILLIQ